MNKTIFISCGQYSESEKRLGKQIEAMVRSLTSLEPYFAETVQDLNGLDANILEALHNCVAFITVLHPRGDIERPDGSVLVRASVWIEQEIAIATYIRRVENRELPIIAFKHKSVGLEGLRTFIQLNPTEFTDDTEVLVQLAVRLLPWKSLKPSGGVELLLTSRLLRYEDKHPISMIETTLVNETNDRIEKFELEVHLPSSILKHWNSKFPSEVGCDVPGLRCFRFDQSGFGPVRPRDRRRLASFEYCTACAGAQNGALAAQERFGARIWVGGKEYEVEKSVEQLAREREG